MTDRRNWLSMLAGVPLLGWMAGPAKASTIRGVATPLKAAVGYANSPKLRVWKIGSLDHRIFPTQESVDKLADLLKGWDGKSDLDLIWGPELTVEQFDLPASGVDVVAPVGTETVVRGADGETRKVATPIIRIVNRAEGQS